MKWAAKQTLSRMPPETRDAKPAPIIALTGATGFLGRYLVQALSANGWRVRALVRSLPLHEQIGTHRIEVVLGDLENAAALRKLTNGADAIVHLAGAIKGDTQTLMRINRDGTSSLIKAWQQNAPTARFLCVSSLTARAPHLSGYGASKQAAEACMLAVEGNWLLVRPPAVYGPYDLETLSIFKAAQLPFHPMLNQADARLSLIHVRDAAEALCALASAGPAQQIVELSDPAINGYSWRDVVVGACAACSRRARPVLIPPSLVKMAAAFNGALARMRGQVRIFDSGKAREILHPDWTAQNHLRVPETIWAPQISLEQGFKETVKWYQQAGWL